MALILEKKLLDQTKQFLFLAPKSLFKELDKGRIPYKPPKSLLLVSLGKTLVLFCATFMALCVIAPTCGRGTKQSPTIIKNHQNHF